MSAAASPAAGPAAGPDAGIDATRGREFGFVAADHRAIAAMVYDEVGILLPDGKAQLVYGRLAPRVRACGLATVGDYVTLIGEDAGEDGVQGSAMLVDVEPGLPRILAELEDLLGGRRRRDQISGGPESGHRSIHLWP